MELIKMENLKLLTMEFQVMSNNTRLLIIIAVLLQSFCNLYLSLNLSNEMESNAVQTEQIEQLQRALGSQYRQNSKKYKSYMETEIQEVQTRFWL